MSVSSQERLRAAPSIVALVVAMLLVVLCVPQSLVQAAGGEPAVVPKPNPSPKAGYDVEFSFAELPGTPAEVVAFAQFEVANRDCVPVDHARAVGGIRLPPTHRQDLALERTSSGAFVARVYEDAYADSDLFGLGDCRWRLDGVTVHFRSAATQFVGGVAMDELRAGQRKVQHYLARDFLAKPAVGDFVFGEKADHYLKSLGPEFTLTIGPRRIP